MKANNTSTIPIEQSYEHKRLPMKLIFSIVFLFATTTVGITQNVSRLKLWYNTPSGATWENALPIGNGRLGAMVYGNVERETIQLNEHTVWSGSPNRNDNPEALSSLPEIRRLIFAGRQKEAPPVRRMRR